MKTSSIVFAMALGIVGVVGCTVNNSTSPPSSPCGQDSSVSCSNGATGYSCDGDNNPEDGDSTLDCGPGTADGSGTDYCCITLQQSTCAPDSSVQGCQAGSYGFSCTGSDTPDDADSNLNCSTGTPASGATLYCCS
jgi:hypothetical protein